MNMQPTTIAASQAYSGGVCAHSMPGRFDDWVIFCVGNDPYREAKFTSWATGLGIGFKSLIGCYKNTTERSFLMSREDYEAHEVSRWTNAEESILVLEPRRRPDGSVEKWSGAPIDAHLAYQDGRREYIGEWIETIEAHAKAEDAWTYDPMFNTCKVHDTEDLQTVARMALTLNPEACVSVKITHTITIRPHKVGEETKS